MHITKLFHYLVIEDGLCLNVRVNVFIKKKTNERGEGIFQCVVGDDLCYKGRGSLITSSM